ncbi:Asp-tRNAAsn/Glu-tRNAGln amidotransferase A subunit [Rhodococcus jostii]|uniref:Asp-tRNAAsn/Glu-tRNAGln amidotransferase A subunit n=2 Tax=Rhodococcus jostii TaxID=132919 RepID=A0A1H4JJN8_RHOJO|nr:Asp-tRNAAsn/Glu-tRNAGln amidotransferase A subunit [Rhodococcus jostii]
MLTGSEALPLLRTGQLTVEGLARSCLKRVAERDFSVRAWSYLDPDAVLAEARRLDREERKGPLHGIPIGVKDVILTKNMPTQQNSPIYADDSPRIDAACIQTLRAAGALIFGKTVTTEFAATASGGPTRNPHDLARTPGGSSSGSGAAVADFHVPITLATQTGGSTIRPASYNGISALKPTWNAINREGLKIFVPSTDTLGFCARSIQDLELLADVFQLEDCVPTKRIELSDARVGLYQGPAWDRAEDATRAAMNLGAALLRDAGAHVDELTLPSAFDDVLTQFGIILAGEARTSFLHEALMHPDILRDEFMAFVDDRNTVSRRDLVDAYDKVASLRRIFDERAGAFDAVLTPSVPGEAPPGIDRTGDPVFNSMWTVLHTPVVNIPGFSGPNGLPVGLSLVSPRYTDRQLLAISAEVTDLFVAKGGWRLDADKRRESAAAQRGALVDQSMPVRDSCVRRY